MNSACISKFWTWSSHSLRSPRGHHWKTWVWSDSYDLFIRFQRWD